MAKEAGKKTCTGCGESIVMVQPGTNKRFRADHTKLRFCDLCRRSEILIRLHGRKVKRTLTSSINRLIQYNVSNEPGWRAGYLLNIGPRSASVQPIGSKGGSCPNIIRVNLADIKAEELQSATMPTVEDYYKVTDKKRVPVLVVQSSLGRLAAAVAASPMLRDGVLCLPNENAEPTLTLDKPTVVRASKHVPLDEAEAIRLYLAGTSMSSIVAAVRGTRAAGGCGNLVRDALRRAGIYKEPTK